MSTVSRNKNNKGAKKMPRLDMKRDPIHKKKLEDGIRYQIPISEKAEGLITKYQQVSAHLNAELAKNTKEQDRALVERQREILKNVSHALASMGIDVTKLVKVR